MPTWFCWHRRSARAGSRWWRRGREQFPAPWQASAPGPRQWSLAAELEQSLGDPADLDLLGALGDPIAAVMTVDVFERLVTAVTEAAEDLHRSIGGVADQSVGAIVGHRHFVRHFHVVVAVQVP